MSVIYLLAAIFLIFGTVSPDLFLSSVTMQSVASSQAVVVLIALAAMLPLIAGEFDITVGSNMALSLVIVTSQSVSHPERSLFVVSVIAILVCGLVGVVNGLLVVKFNLNSFIATLAMSQVLAAIALNISGNQQIRGVFPEGFSEFGQARWLGLPAPMIFALVVAVILWYLLEWTKLGRHLVASGSNREAARLSGVQTGAFIIGSFVASGVIAGAAGVLYASQVGAFSNSVGMPLLFPAFAAVFLGATQFNRRPNVWGTVLAIITLAFGVQGLQLTLDANSLWLTPMFNGIALILAVLLTARQATYAERASKKIDTHDPEPTGGGSPLGASEPETNGALRT